MSGALVLVATRDGRRLGVAEWGDPAGRPVIGLHGTPGSRLGRSADEAALAAAGVRLITLDRPGYGESDRLPGRRVVDVAADVAAVADALGLDRVAVTGGSGGGPHALAVAARLGDRITAVECRVSPAPIDAAGLDWFGGMDPENVEEFGWALAGEERLRPELERLRAEDLERLDREPGKVLSDDWTLDEADRERLARPDLARVLEEELREAHRPGVDGWIDDDLALVAPWGFDVAAIAVPVTVRYGVHDVIVPAAHGAWLGERIPGAAVVPDAGGHIGDPSARVRQLQALAAAT